MDFPSHSSCKRKFYIPGKNLNNRLHSVFSITNPLSSIFRSCAYKYISSIHINHTFSKETTNGLDVKSIAGHGELLWSFLLGPTQLLFSIAKRHFKIIMKSCY